jgi:hypothetical protein
MNLLKNSVILCGSLLLLTPVVAAVVMVMKVWWTMSIALWGLW